MYFTCLGLATDSRAGERPSSAYLGFVSLGLALLAKGPVGLAIAFVMVVLWAVLSGKRASLRRIPWLRGMLLSFAVAAPWYVAAELRTPGFLRDFLWNEHVLRFLGSDYGDMYGKGHTFPRGMIPRVLDDGGAPVAADLDRRGLATVPLGATRVGAFADSS